MTNLMPPEDQQYRTVAPPPRTTTTAPAPTPAPAPTSVATTTSAPDGPGDYTDDEATRFNGLPGEPEIWKDAETGEHFVVYYPEGFEPKIPLLFVISTDDELKSLFGDKPVTVDKTLTPDQMMKAGAIEFGEMASIDRYNANGELIRDPWAGFTSRMDRARERFPWFDEDPEVFAIVAGAYLEGREVEEWEIEGTDYFQSVSGAEREAMRMQLSDPVGYEDRYKNIAIDVSDYYGIHGVDPNQDVVDWLSREVNAGRMTAAMAKEQIAVLVGRGTGELDDRFSEWLTDNDVQQGGATSYLQEVRDLYTEWLGPMYPPDDAALTRWAKRLTDNYAGGKDMLENMLRQHRVALYPQYENPNLTYNDIAAPWKSFTERIWGVPVEDTDTAIQRIIGLNDAMEAQKVARKVGSDRGYTRIVEEMAATLEGSMRSGVRGEAF